MFRKSLVGCFAALALLAGSAQAVWVDVWVTVGDPENVADTEVMDDGTTGYGSVDHVPRFSLWEDCFHC